MEKFRTGANLAPITLYSHMIQCLKSQGKINIMSGSQPKDTKSSITQSDPEKEKLEIEREKLSIERAKLELESRKLETTVLIEDFKAQWQRLMNFENENSRWISVYASVLLISLSWVITNSQSKTLIQIFQSEDNFHVLLALVLVNSVYVLSLAWRGYQFHLLAIFIYEKISLNIMRAAKTEFNVWWEFRRPKSYLDNITTIYYVLMSLLPFSVSLAVLIMIPTNTETYKNNYINYVYYFLAWLIFLICTVASVATSFMEQKWKKAIADRISMCGKFNLELPEKY